MSTSTHPLRTFTALVGKEWRDVRALTWTSMLLVVVAAALTRWLLGAIEHDVWASSPGLWWNGRFNPASTRWWGPFVPGAAAFYAALVTADAVGGEIAALRGDALALLPTGRLRVWTAKAAFLLVATLLFAAWTVSVQIATLWSVDGLEHAAAFIDRARDGVWVVGALAVLAGATLLVSTLRLRGIGAALVGAGVAAALWLGANAGAEVLGYRSVAYQPFLPFATHEREWIAALVTAPALLVAAAMAYAYGRVHLGRVLRPLGIAAASLVVLVAAPGAVLARTAFSVVPGAPGVVLNSAWPRPDGRFVALTFTDFERRTHPSKTFVLDVERHALVEPDCGNLVVDPVPPTWEGIWDADGALIVASFAVSEAQGRTGISSVCVDPASGLVLRRSPADAAALDARTAAFRSVMLWYVSRSGRARDGGAPFEATVNAAWTGKRVLDVRSWVPVQLDMRHGEVLFAPEPNVLSARTLPDGEPRVLITSAEPWRVGQFGGFSQDGREVLVAPDGAWTVVDLRTGQRTTLPRCESAPSWWGSQGGAPRRRVVLRGAREADPCTVLDLDTSSRLDVPSRRVATAYGLADGGFVSLGEDGVVDLHGPDLQRIRQIWPVTDAGRQPGRGNR